MPKKYELTGQRFGRLVVRGQAVAAKPSTWWVCDCDCGNWTITKTKYLNNGDTKSCGCLINDWASKMGSSRRLHGATQTPEYHAWEAMKKRCQDKPGSKWQKHYWDKGIRVCPEWEGNFLAFREHIGPRPCKGYSVDRIDNSRGYEPGNVRWATAVQQAANKG